MGSSHKRCSLDLKLRADTRTERTSIGKELEETGAVVADEVSVVEVLDLAGVGGSEDEEVVTDMAGCSYQAVQEGLVVQTYLFV